jgi:hypothetical protein
MLLCVLACLAAVTVRAQNADSFPRLAGIFISDPRNFEDAGYQEDIAKLDYAIMGVYPGWEERHGITMEEVLKRIKTINPRIRIFLYFCAESRKYPNPAWPGLSAKLDSERWWAYPSGGSGSKVLSDFGNGTYIVNLTNFTPADSGGKRANQWIAELVLESLIKSTPSADGIFTDNVFWKPRRDADWNRDGRIDSQNDPAVQKYYREGNVTYLNKLKALMPGRLQIGNVADWGKREATLTEYEQVLAGGVLENIIGKRHSAETFLPWSEVLVRYKKTMAAFGEPKLGMFSQSGSPTDYQGFRYGFATALLDDAYYAYHDESKGFSGVTWFDEFDVKLGRATSAPPTAAWQNGVWRRDFDGGIALVNPKGNGAREVTLETDFRRIAGKQDRTVNNGQVVRKVKLRDRDGIVLLSNKRRPRSPAGVKITKAG